MLYERGISKSQFYQDCGITSAAFSQWRTGKTYPRRSKIEFIAKYFGVPPAYLTATAEEAKAIILNATMEKVGLVYGGASPTGLPACVPNAEKPTTPEGDGLSDFDRSILAFLHELPPERLRGILIALDAPSELLSALDREAPQE